MFFPDDILYIVFNRLSDTDCITAQLFLQRLRTNLQAMVYDRPTSTISECLHY